MNTTKSRLPTVKIAESQPRGSERVSAGKDATASKKERVNRVREKWEKIFEELEEGLTKSQLSEILGIKRDKSIYLCKQYGYKAKRENGVERRWKKFFDNLERGFTRKEIYEIIIKTDKISRSTVYFLCKKFNYELTRKNMKRYDWDSVDWKMCDSRIVEQLGCSRQCVHEVRKKNNIPKSNRENCTGYLKTEKKETTAIKKSIENLKDIQGIELIQSAEWKFAFSDSELSQETIKKNLYKNGIKNIKENDSFRYTLSSIDFNWDICSRDLALIWDIYDVSISWSRIRQGNKQKPMFIGQQHKERETNKEYLELLELEKVKAKKYYEKIREVEEKRKTIISTVKKEYSKQIEKLSEES